MLWKIEDTGGGLRLVLAKDMITYPIEMTGFEGLIKILKEDHIILGRKVRNELRRKTYTEVKRRLGVEMFMSY